VKIFCIRTFFLVLTSFLIFSCQSTENLPENNNSQPKSLVVMTHDSFSVSEDVIKSFESQNNVKINFLLSGDTGAAINRAILTKNSPQADVFYGIDNTFMSRALSEEIFEPYASSALVNIRDDLKLDPSNRLLPVDFGDVCINYDKAYFQDRSISVPRLLSELTSEQYKGLLVVENPATSSPGLAFLMATIAEYGEEGYIQYWKDLKENGLVIVNDWETAYYTNFSASSGKGNQPMVVSYSTSPAAEVLFSDQPLTDSPTSSIIEGNSCFRQIEFVGILSGTKERELSEKFIDFVLGLEFQEDLPLQMFVYPSNNNAKLPMEFTSYVEVPSNPARLDPELISLKREIWIDAWTKEILRK
jgi:thiamine transport system substrate-binding protein